MRIELSDSTGRPEPQFVVYAENEQDRMFLKMFLTIPDYTKEKLYFNLHGHGGQGKKYEHFNFGWAKKNE
jgi:hypothetical protein